MSQAVGNVRCSLTYASCKLLLKIFQTTLAYVRTWHHVDASERVLGKLADRIATVLMGKHKPIYDPSSVYDYQTWCFIH